MSKNTESYDRGYYLGVNSKAKEKEVHEEQLMKKLKMFKDSHKHHLTAFEEVAKNLFSKIEASNETVFEKIKTLKDSRKKELEEIFIEFALQSRAKESEEVLSRITNALTRFTQILGKAETLLSEMEEDWQKSKTNFQESINESTNEHKKELKKFIEICEDLTEFSKGYDYGVMVRESLNKI